LLAVAIVDDLGAILVIAFFYTSQIKGAGLGIAALAFGVATLLKYSGVRSYLVYTFVGVFVWAGFLYSGVHATIAGVLLGLLTPTHFPTDKKTKELYSPLDELLHFIHPWVSFAIMPIFAFANAGINLTGVDIVAVLSSPITLGIVFGLLVGKPIGVFIFSYIAVKWGGVKLPKGMNFANITGVGFLAGIGFTMSLFISGLALPPDLEVYSKTGIVVGSIVSGLIGAFLLYISSSKPKPVK
ncbi:MAG: Na+/H+ antiporter NhaA, partial [Bdellovibrionales bacterium]|nr:Na+/H+ antiporter NhaA [Bdellovibrionales bacterium]